MYTYSRQQKVKVIKYVLNVRRIYLHNIFSVQYSAGFPHIFKNHFPYFFNITLKKFNTITSLYF